MLSSPVGSVHKKDLFVGVPSNGPHKQILLVDRSHGPAGRQRGPVGSVDKRNLFVVVPNNRPHKQIIPVGIPHGPARGPRRRGGYFEFLKHFRFFQLFARFSNTGGSAHKKNLFVGSVIGDPHKQILLVDRSHRTPLPPSRPV